MRTIYTFILCLFAYASFAQAPQFFNYQGAARDGQGNELVNQDISLRISVLDLNATGPAVYVETHSVTTNEFGLFAIAVGGGDIVSGTFGGISWGSGSKFLKVEMDATGGTSYVMMGTSQLLSTPYALYAEKAGSADASSTIWNTNANGVDYDGNVGIGTTAPTAPFEINKNMPGPASRTFVKLHNTNTTGYSLSNILMSAGSDASLGSISHFSRSYTASPRTVSYAGKTLYSNEGEGLLFRATDVGQIEFITGTDDSDLSTKMLLNKAGNLGIGTTTPSEKLTVDGTIETTNGGVKFPDGTIQTTAALSGASPWNTNSNGVDYSGKVGIGTNTPNYPLNIVANTNGQSSDRTLIRLENKSTDLFSTMSIQMFAGESGSYGSLGHSSSTYEAQQGYKDKTTLTNTGQGLVFKSLGNGSIEFKTGSDNSVESTKILINREGSIGIGTTEPKAKVEVSQGDVYISDAANGVIMKSPNGTCFRMTVSDGGTPVFTSITCP